MPHRNTQLASRGKDKFLEIALKIGAGEDDFGEVGDLGWGGWMDGWMGGWMDGENGMTSE